MKVPYSVLLLFTAPGSFSCNLKERQKTAKGKCEKGNLDRWRIAMMKMPHIHLLGHRCVDLSAYQVNILVNLGLEEKKD